MKICAGKKITESQNKFINFALSLSKDFAVKLLTWNYKFHSENVFVEKKKISDRTGRRNIYDSRLFLAYILAFFKSSVRKKSDEYWFFPSISFKFITKRRWTKPLILIDFMFYERKNFHEAHFPWPHISCRVTIAWHLRFNLLH